MRVFTQVVGLETGDSTPSLAVVTDTGRFMFNVGEGLQRFAAEHRLRLVKLDHVFFTRVSLETLGGLPGMLLTLADSGRNSMTVHGGPGLSDFIFGCRHFLRRDDTSLDLFEISRDCIEHGGDTLSSIMVSGMTVKPFLLLPRAAGEVLGCPLTRSTSQLREFQRFYSEVRENRYFGVPLNHALLKFRSSAEDRVDSSRRQHTDKPAAAGSAATTTLRYPFSPLALAAWPVMAPRAASGDRAVLPYVLQELGALRNSGGANDRAPYVAASDVAVCYVLRAPAIPGKFFPQRARAWGVAPGPMFGVLSGGGTVETSLPLTAAIALLRPAGSTSAPASASTGATADLAAWLAAHPRVVGVEGEGPAARVHLRVSVGDVKDPDIPGAVIAIIDVPTLSHLPDLFDSSDLREFRPIGGHEPLPAAASKLTVYHFSPSTVVATPSYVAWMHEFGPSVQHVVLSRPAQRPKSTESAISQSNGALDAQFWGGCCGGDAESAYLRPFMHRAQALQQLKMHLFHARAFTLPFPVATRAAEHSCSGVLPFRASMLQQLVASSVAEPQRRQFDGDGDPSVAESAVANAPSLTPSSLRRAYSVDACLSVVQVPPLDGLMDGCHSVSPTVSVPVVQAPPLMMHMLAPVANVGFDLSLVPPPVTPQEAMRELAAQPLFEEQLLPLLRDALSQLQLCGEVAASAPKSGADCCPVTTAAAADLGVEHTSAQVVFSGTSSAVPSKYRNVTGILVTMPPPALSLSSDASCSGGGGGGLQQTPPEQQPQRSIVLDCGEGTYGQLTRRFGFAREHAASRAAQASAASHHQGGGAAASWPVEAALRSVAALWVSHMHADHHLGLARLIKERRAALLQLQLLHEAGAGASGVAGGGGGGGGGGCGVVLPQPVLVVGPSRIYHWLLEASALEPDLVGWWRFVDAEHFLHAPPPVPGAMPAGAAATGDEPAAAATRSDVSGADWGQQRAPATSSVPAVDSAAADAEGGGASKPPAKRARISRAVPAAEPATAAENSAVAASASASAASDAPLGPAAIDRCEPQPPAVHHIVPLPASDDDALCPATLLPWPVAIASGIADADTASGAPCPGCASASAPLAHVIPAAAHLASPDFVRAALRSLGVTALRTTRVQHCYKAYAVRLEVASCAATAAAAAAVSAGAAACWSLVYSGDTRPCEEVVRLGRGARKGGLAPVYPRAFASLLGAAASAASASASASSLPAAEAAVAASGGASDGCSLLIHEATFEDTAEGRASARDKRHSTVGEAVAVADGMGARHTLLTHFSARYPKLPVLKMAGGGGAGGRGGRLAADADADRVAAAAGCGGGGAAASAEGRLGGRTLFVAYDLMTAAGADLGTLPDQLPGLHALFAAGPADGDEVEAADDGGAGLKGRAT